MKKFISIFCAVAMLFSLVITANAANNEITLDLVSQDATTAIYNVNLKSADYAVGVLSTYVSWTDALAKGATVKVEQVNATASYNTNAKAVAISFAPTDGSTLTGSVTLAKLTIDMTNVTESFTIAKAVGNSRLTTSIKRAPQGEETQAVDITSSFDTNFSATVAPYVAPKTEETAPVNPANENAEFKFDGQTWTNVAIYEASFVLADIDTTKDYGIKEGNNKFSASIAGEGTTTFVLAYYGVTTAPTVEKFWTGK